MMADSIQISLLGYALQLARPDRVGFVAAALLFAVFAAYGIRARRLALRSLAGTPRLAQRLGGGASLSRMIAKGALTSMGLLALSLALLQPRIGERTATAKRKGIDLVVAVDASRSMLARDVLPSRLDRAKLELSTLIDRLHGDRIGVVAFAGAAFVQCPLTNDYGAAKLFLRAIDPEVMPSQGTAIAAALDTARTMLGSADRGAKAKVVLLLTDGEDHSGEVLAAGKRLQDEGVKIFALGIGSPTGTPVPLLDSQGRISGYMKDRHGDTVISRLEEGQLRELALATGGKFVTASGSDLGMGEIRAELDRLEKSEFESLASVEYEEAFAYALFPGFVLLLGGALLREGRRPA